MSLTIERAGASELRHALALYREAVAWLASQGVDQWQGMAGFEGRIGADIESGVIWVIRGGKLASRQITAMIKLDSRADPEFWRLEDDPDDALYAHRMVVARADSGKGIGSAMLDWASRRAAGAGKRWLRLDAWANNTKLHDYYLREEFTMVRLVQFAHRGSGALFQRPAGIELRRGPRLVSPSTVSS